MRNWLGRFFGRGEPTVNEANTRDAPRLAVLHAASFHRGWSEDEFERLLIERNVLAHCARAGRSIIGFIMSRMVSGEAEILSVAVASSHRGRGIAGRLLDVHLRRLAGLGTKTVFLEVEEDNASACRLYAHARFREVGRRKGYYPRTNNQAATALILRRDLV
ncbi:MAG TPA: ribosomal protein S18-alanine N-acetyltransferase [Xanthobacteraceae bacterium]|nr:ribosomal protein S18-alanine N-acetyltransferase [Xanthobacteraceae bacterium]